MGGQVEFCEMKEETYVYQSPIGALMLTEVQGALLRVSYQKPEEQEGQEGQEGRSSVFGQGEPVRNAQPPATPLLREAVRQLEEYFSGRRREFQLPLHLKGTEFQKRVWQALQEIPYGETRSYSQIAEQIGNPKAVRAVGMANHRNPIMVIVPCHRVIGKNQSMTGYACGIEVKEALLHLEGNHDRS